MQPLLQFSLCASTKCRVPPKTQATWREEAELTWRGREAVGESVSQSVGNLRQNHRHHHSTTTAPPRHHHTPPVHAPCTRHTHCSERDPLCAGLRCVRGEVGLISGVHVSGVWVQLRPGLGYTAATSETRRFVQGESPGLTTW